MYIHPALVCIVLCQYPSLCTPKPFYQPVLEVYEALGTLVHDYLVASTAGYVARHTFSVLYAASVARKKCYDRFMCCVLLGPAKSPLPHPVLGW